MYTAETIKLTTISLHFPCNGYYDYLWPVHLELSMTTQEACCECQGHLLQQPGTKGRKIPRYCQALHHVTYCFIRQTLKPKYPPTRLNISIIKNQGSAHHCLQKYYQDLFFWSTLSSLNLHKAESSQTDQKHIEILVCLSSNFVISASLSLPLTVLLED